MSDHEILVKAISTFGEQSQKQVAIEEMSELTKEICKDFRRQANYTALAEEIADVEIMLAQLLIIYDSWYDAFIDKKDRIKKQKLIRLEKRMREYRKVVPDNDID